MKVDYERVVRGIMGEYFWCLGRWVNYCRWESYYADRLMVMVGDGVCLVLTRDESFEFDLGDPGLIEKVRAEVERWLK